MSREIKYFKGSTSGGTLYTVPAGRTAKIIINYFIGNIGGSPSVSIDATEVCPQTSSVGLKLAAIVASSTPMPAPAGYIGVTGGAPDNIADYYVQKEWFVGPGSTVIASSATFPVHYSFMAIEEY
jgi:hypothetical protein